MPFDPASIEAVRRLELDLDLSTAKVRRQTKDAVRKFAFQIQRSAKLRAPVDTGALRNSINTTVTEHVGGGASAEVGPEVDYAPFLEFGTVRMEPRPFLGPAFDRFEPDFLRALADIETGLER